MSALEPKVVRSLPTELESRPILDLMIACAEGETLTKEALAAAAGLEPNTPRFRTVVSAARRILYHTHNMRFQAVRGVGIRKLPENERVVEVVVDAGRGARIFGRALQEAENIRTERLTEAEQAQTLHVRRAMTAVVGEIKHTRKEIVFALTPVKSLPRGKQ